MTGAALLQQIIALRDQGLGYENIEVKLGIPRDKVVAKSGTIPVTVRDIVIRKLRLKKEAA